MKTFTRNNVKRKNKIRREYINTDYIYNNACMLTVIGKVFERILRL